MIKYIQIEVIIYMKIYKNFERESGIVTCVESSLNRES